MQASHANKCMKYISVKGREGVSKLESKKVIRRKEVRKGVRE